MKRASIAAVLIGSLIGLAALAASDIPLVCEETIGSAHKRCGISQAEAREAVRFVRTIPGISHSIIMVDGLNPPEVSVMVGELSAPGGHTIYLRKVGRQWTVAKTEHWKWTDFTSM